MSQYDAVVVGLGAVGSFALRALSRTPGRWLGIERFSLGSHARGSSHGKTRIYRRAYFEHPHYVPWIEYSIGAFRELEESHPSSALMQECGMLLMAPKGEDRSKHNLPTLLAASVRAATEHNVPVHLLDTDDLKREYPQFCYDHDMIGILEPGAGILRPERIIQAAQADALSSGNATLQGHTEVTSIESRSDGKLSLRVVISETDAEPLDAQVEEEIVTSTVLIAAGAWISQFVPQWKPYLTVTRQIQAWIDTSHKGNDYTYNNMPSWFMETPHWHVPVYGIPADPTEDTMNRWIKVGTHCSPTLVPDPSAHSDRVTSQECGELQRTTRMGLNPTAWGGGDSPEFVATEPCLYTMSPDSHFMIGSPSPRVFAVSACSGHGFKMAPALGEMMSDFAQGKAMAKWRLGFCDPERFKKQCHRIMSEDT